MASPTLDPSRIDARAEELREQVIAWRRHLHAHPELSFEEHETSAWVAARLEEIGGLEISRPTPTSVMARLRGERSGSDEHCQQADQPRSSGQSFHGEGCDDRFPALVRPLDLRHFAMNFRSSARPEAQEFLPQIRGAARAGQ